MGDEFQTWKEHFIEQAKGLVPHQRKFYRVSMQHGKGGEPPIKMVSPTEQVVERAKSTLSQPPTIYDPVTGIMQHANRKHSKINTPRKRKHKSQLRVKTKKIKIRKTPKPRKVSKLKKRVLKKKASKKHKPRRITKKQNSKKKWWL